MRAVFLDRDGVINELVPDPVDGRPESPIRADDVELAAQAVEGLRALQSAGLLLIVVSNQPAAAKGKATLERTGFRAEYRRLIPGYEEIPRWSRSR